MKLAGYYWDQFYWDSGRLARQATRSLSKRLNLSTPAMWHSTTAGETPAVPVEPVPLEPGQ